MASYKGEAIQEVAAFQKQTRKIPYHNRMGEFLRHNSLDNDTIYSCLQ